MDEGQIKKLICPVVYGAGEAREALRAAKIHNPLGYNVIIYHNTDFLLHTVIVARMLHW